MRDIKLLLVKMCYDGAYEKLYPCYTHRSAVYIVSCGFSHSQPSHYTAKTSGKKRLWRGGGFVGAVCQYKGGGISGKKKSRVSLPSDFFRGIDTGIPYENTKWKKRKMNFKLSKFAERFMLNLLCQIHTCVGK